MLKHKNIHIKCTIQSIQNTVISKCACFFAHGLQQLCCMRWFRCREADGVLDKGAGSLTPPPASRPMCSETLHESIPPYYCVALPLHGPLYCVEVVQLLHRPTCSVPLHGSLSTILPLHEPLCLVSSVDVVQYCWCNSFVSV